MLYSVLAIVAAFAILAWIISRVEGLTLFAPKSSAGVSRSAGEFCHGRCRTPDGRCPLTGTAEAAADCPLWRYVSADLSTTMVGSPFAHLRPS